MRIAKAVVNVLRVPVEPPYYAAGKKVTDYWHVLARVTTHSGVEGFGYVVLLHEQLVRPLADATRELAQHLVGLHVFETEAAWSKLARAGDLLGPGGMINYAIAPLDIALWDAAGKVAGQPLYRLLGGFRDRVPTYASDGMWYNLSLDDLAAAAKRHVDQGFTAVKLRIGHEKTPAGEVARVMAVRGAVGPDVDILVDATETWDINQALKTGRALQAAGVHWLEDPVNHVDLVGMARAVSLLEVPIATGEHLYTLSEYALLFEARATGIAIIDLARIGGITPWRRVANLAQAHNIRVCGHVLPELHIHLLASAPNGYLCEYVPRSERILAAMPKHERGFMIAPDRPGIGLDLDQDAVQRYIV